MGQLDGKVAWVTGAGSGIRESAAVALSAAGAIVVLTGRTISKLERMAARIGPAEHVAPGDVTDAELVQRIVDRFCDRFGRLDIVVTSAGVNIPDRAWGSLTPGGVDELIQANLASVFYCATAVLPIMRTQQDGLLIVIASVAGRHVNNLGGPGYTAAKHGAVALSHSINVEECVHGIRATAILPGEVATHPSWTNARCR